jgi:hypothetical protein
MRAALNRDGRAYDRLLRALAPLVRGIVRAHGCGLRPAACEDVVQEVLLALHAKRHTSRSEAQIPPWIYAIVRYRVADAFRARGCPVEVPVEDLAEPAAPNGPKSTRLVDTLRMMGRSRDGWRKSSARWLSTGACLAESAGAVSPGSGRDSVIEAVPRPTLDRACRLRRGRLECAPRRRGPRTKPLRGKGACGWRSMLI